MQIEAATPQEARAIAQVQVLSWQHAYEGILPRDYLATLSVDEREARWRHVLTEAQAQVLVARADGQLQGFIAFGPSRDADVPPTTAEVWAFYLAPSAWSRGWGRRLWLAARAQLQSRAYASVRLWVLAANARAILFYAAAGFAPEAGSARELSMAGLRLRELRCAVRLDG